ncbi:hypothetical protein VTJ04DRAFT_40 [Mycothermus thermophilus]|uniref:uncharacterized protein n=1 Tax=Humicola insolens TaxID=85995 RepID=UPI0037441E29
MSQKITAKNLQFNRTLPPFLARLRGEADADRGDGPDPILAARRRPTKPRSASEEAEDAPVVVDEQGNVVEGDAVEVHKDGSVTVKPEECTKTEEGKEEEGKDADGKATASTAPAENLASVGGLRKKRKIARVVGAAEENDGGDGGDKDADGDRKASGKSASAGSETASSGITNGTGSSATAKDKPKKKAKKIKLSFDDDT